MTKEGKLFFFWVLLALLCRFIFMPFTLHPDLLHIYYHPHFLASKGVWNIYEYHADYFKKYYCYYYPPLTYLFFGSYLYLVGPILSGFDDFMEGVRRVSDNGGGHSGHYLAGAPTQRLFRFLFLMKLPYLFFDIALLGILLKFMPHHNGAGLSKSFGLLKWWALNPLPIYTCYLVGQFDIIPAFIIAVAAYLAYKDKKILSMVFLGIGAAFKSFPLFLLFPFSFYMGRDIKGIIKYALAGILPFLIIIGPFYVFSRGEVMGAFFSQRIIQRLGFTVVTSAMIRFFVFLLGYLILCFSLLKKTVRDKMGGLWPVKISFFTLALLFIAFPISFHYFLWITPFILILGCSSRFRIIYPYLLAIFLLALITLAGKGMWMGLFSPIYPEFFIGLPSLDEVIKRSLPYAFIKQIAAFAFIGTMIWMSILVLMESREAPSIQN